MALKIIILLVCVLAVTMTFRGEWLIKTFTKDKEPSAKRLWQSSAQHSFCRRRFRGSIYSNVIKQTRKGMDIINGRFKNIAKNYNPAEFEDRIYNDWVDKKYFHAKN